MTDEMDLEELELNLIDAGVEELESQEQNLFIYVDYTAFGTISKGLEDMGISVQKSGLKRYATSPVEFTEEQLVRGEPTC